MRYKVKVDPLASFEEVAKAAASLTHVFVASEGRRTLSVGDLSKRGVRHLQSLGAQVAPEMRYDADRSAA